MKFFIYILLIVSIASCNRRYCQPSKRSIDYAVKSIKRNADGSALVKLVRYDRGVKIVQPVLFECLPDSITEGQKISADVLRVSLASNR